MKTSTLGWLVVWTMVASLPTAAGVAQAGPAAKGKIGLHPYLTLGYGEWTKSEIDPISGQPINTIIGGGNGFGLRATYLVVDRIGGWVSGDGAIATEGGYTSAFIGPVVRFPLEERVTIDFRAGAGWLDDAPFAVGGADLQLFLFPRLSVAVSGEYTTPIGDGSRETGSGKVTVKRDGGPRRLQFGFVWYPR